MQAKKLIKMNNKVLVLTKIKMKMEILMKKIITNGMKKMNNIMKTGKIKWMKLKNGMKIMYFLVMNVMKQNVKHLLLI